MLLDSIRGLIFDLDGTLVDTDIIYLQEVVKSALREIGYKEEVNKEDVALFWYGKNKDNTIKIKWGVDIDMFWNSFRKYDTVEGRIENTKIFEDISILKNLNYKKLSIFTESQKNIALEEVKLIKPYLDITSVVIGGRDGIKYKPDPSGIYKCLELMELEAKEALVIGDSEWDMEAAKNAGAKDCFINRLNKNPSEVNARYITQDFYGLLLL